MSLMSPAPAGNVAAPALVWVAGPGGCQTPALAAEAARLAEKDGFTWIDLEETGEAGLRQISEVLDIGTETFEALRQPDRRPSFTPLADATYAALPVMDRAVLPAGARPRMCVLR